MSESSAPVVVAVDGGPRSVGLLRWAAFEALRRHADLVAVHAYGQRRPVPTRAAENGACEDGAAGARAAARLRDRLDAAFPARPPVRVRAVCDSRGPVQALLPHSAAAGLLVLGARPSPRRRGAVGGTVARRCLQAAACPVVVMLASAPPEPVPVGRAGATPPHTRRARRASARRAAG